MQHVHAEISDAYKTAKGHTLMTGHSNTYVSDHLTRPRPAPTEPNRTALSRLCLSQPHTAGTRHRTTAGQERAALERRKEPPRTHADYMSTRCNEREEPPRRADARRRGHMAQGSKGVSDPPARSRPGSRCSARGSAAQPRRVPFGDPCRSAPASRAARWRQPARSRPGSWRCAR
jgi:hypothetical protein